MGGGKVRVTITCRCMAHDGLGYSLNYAAAPTARRVKRGFDRQTECPYH